MAMNKLMIPRQPACLLLLKRALSYKYPLSQVSLILKWSMNKLMSYGLPIIVIYVAVVTHIHTGGFPVGGRSDVCIPRLFFIYM